jgi:hypothetical protein
MFVNILELDNRNSIGGFERLYYGCDPFPDLRERVSQVTKPGICIGQDYEEFVPGDRGDQEGSFLVFLHNLPRETLFQFPSLTLKKFHLA